MHRRERMWAFFELLALVGFAVAQPTLGVLGKAPDFFLFRRAGRGEVLVLVLAVTVLPALGLWLAGQVAGLAGERARRLVHLVMGPPDKFSAVALDTLFKQGENRLELFVVDDSGGRPRLRPLTVS